MAKMKVYKTPEGKLVAADPVEAEAFGWTPQQVVETKTYTPTGQILKGTTFVPAPEKKETVAEASQITPQEVKTIAEKGGGVIQTIGKTMEVKPSKKYIEKEIQKTEKLSPSVEQEMKYYIGGLPVSKGVYEKYSQYVQEQQALQARQYYEEHKLRYLASTIQQRPLQAIHYGIFYDPFGLRQSIAATAVKLRGGTLEEARKAAFEAGPVSYYKESYYKPTEFIASSALVGALWSIPIASVKAPIIGKIAERGFQAFMTIQTAQFIKEPVMEKGLGIVATVGTYGLIKAGPSVAQRLLKPRMEKESVAVEYVKEEKAVIAEEILEFKSDYKTGRMITTYYTTRPSKEIANAFLLQKETGGGLIRTIVTPEGRMISPPKDFLRFEYGPLKREFLSMGLGTQLETLPKKLPYGLYPVKEYIISPQPTTEPFFSKTIKIGIELEKKPFIVFQPPADIKKTPLSRTFPEWKYGVVKPPKYFYPISKAVGGIQVKPPMVTLKTAPIRIDTIRDTATITGFEEIPRIFPEPRIYIPVKEATPDVILIEGPFPPIEMKHPKQWEWTLPIQKQIPLTEEQRRQRYLESQRQQKTQIQFQKQTEGFLKKEAEKILQTTTPITTQIGKQMQLQKGEEKQLQRQMQRQLQKQIPRELQKIEKRKIEPPSIFPTLIPKSTVKKIKYKKPSMVKFYPRGRKRRKYRIVPRAGLMSLGREMGESIARGKWKTSEPLPKTKKVRKEFTKQMFTKMLGMEFPTAKMYQKGTELKFAVGKPSIKSIMPSFLQKRKKRRK